MRTKILRTLLTISFYLVAYKLTAQVSGAASRLVEHASLAVPQESVISDIGSHPDDVPAIRNMVRQGVMTNASENKFEPDAQMTRAEFAESIQRLFHLSRTQMTQFPDVTSATPSKDAIAAVAPFMNRQIVCITCALSKNFYPNEPITSDLALVAVVGILSAQKKIELVTDQEAKEALSGLPEVQQSGPAAAPYFATAIKLGVVTTPGRFFPVVKSTRADMAVLFDHVQTQFSIPVAEPKTR